MTFDFISSLKSIGQPGGSACLLIFADQGVVIVDSSSSNSVVMVEASDVAQLSVGTASRTQHRGFATSEQGYWTISIGSTSGATYSRYLPLGSGEESANAFRKHYTSALKLAAAVYPVTLDGGHVHTEAGMTISYGIGFWRSVD